MKYYGFRFYAAAEQILKNMVRGKENAYHVDPELYGEDYAMQWTKHMAEELDEFRKNRKTRLVRNEEKVATYEKYARLAYALAKKRDFDVVISDVSGEYGLIVLHRYAIFLAKDQSWEDIKTLVELMVTADELYIDADDDLLYFQFVYDLCDVVEQE